MSAELIPVESMVLTIAREQIQRGENPPINTTAVLVYALDRLTGHHDWTQDEETARSHHQPDYTRLTATATADLCTTLAAAVDELEASLSPSAPAVAARLRAHLDHIEATDD